MAVFRMQCHQKIGFGDLLTNLCFALWQLSPYWKGSDRVTQIPPVFSDARGSTVVSRSGLRQCWIQIKNLHRSVRPFPRLWRQLGGHCSRCNSTGRIANEVRKLLNLMNLTVIQQLCRFRDGFGTSINQTMGILDCPPNLR